MLATTRVTPSRMNSNHGLQFGAALARRSTPRLCADDLFASMIRSTNFASSLNPWNLASGPGPLTTIRLCELVGLTYVNSRSGQQVYQELATAEDPRSGWFLARPFLLFPEKGELVTTSMLVWHPRPLARNQIKSAGFVEPCRPVSWDTVPTLGLASRTEIRWGAGRCPQESEGRYNFLKPPGRSLLRSFHPPLTEGSLRLRSRQARCR